MNYGVTEASSGGIGSIIIAFSCLRMSFLLSGRGSRVPPRVPVRVPPVKVPEKFAPATPVGAGDPGY